MSTDGSLILSNGLRARPIATSGAPVLYADDTVESLLSFHSDPDGAAIFANNDTGGWVYVSNAKNGVRGSDWFHGGVGAIDFDADGNVTGYRRIASNTLYNCGGGRTPWNSWVTCEEDTGGRCHQVDPFGRRKPLLTQLGAMGWYESFAYDDTTEVPTFYITRDDTDGALTRFTPNAFGMQCYNREKDLDKWCTLTQGTIDYLVLEGEGSNGTFRWSKSLDEGEASAKEHYRFSEGIDAYNGTVYFTSKEQKRLIILDLSAMTYSYESTISGAFDTSPDQVGRILGGDHGILYFCEDGGRDAGVHGRSVDGEYFTVLYGNQNVFAKPDETIGLAFSPDALHMYVSMQAKGAVYDITREDGLRFDGALLDINYHT